MKFLNKRIISLLLMLTLLIEGLFPVLSVYAVDSTTNEVAPLAEDSSKQLQATVEKQIRAFAKSINQSNADDSAAKALATHGITSSGKKLSVGKSHALTATLWNSELLQVATIDTCVAAIDYMQKLDKDYLPNVNGFYAWNGSNRSYGTFVCIVGGTYEQSNREYTLHHVPSYTGKQNAYDNSLDWMAGTTGIAASFQTKKVTADAITYSVTYSIWDRFDFSTSNNSGFKNLISGLAALLFREFDWESKVTFELTVPYSCDHSTNNYHWTYDAANKTLTSDGSREYTENGVTRHTYENTSGKISYYYELDETVRLYHDKPWVMEYTIRNPGNFVIAPLNQSTILQPYLMNYGKSGLLFQHRNVVNNQITYNCYGTYYSGLLSSQITYTFRLENVIDSKGNNMVYLTIINADNQTTVLNKIPMDDYYENINGVLTLKNSSSSYWNGTDFFITYIGTKANHFSANYFDLTIWENGIDSGDGDYFTSKVTKPTCAAKGYTTHTCSLCGYSYKDTYTPKTDHKFGSWKKTADPTCEDKGTETRTCSGCGTAETRPIDALGHSYTSVVTPPTCTEKGYASHTCALCSHSYKDTYTAKTDHKFGSWKKTADPTCEGIGTETRICSGCGTAETRPIDALGHSYTSAVTPPTCTAQGFTTYTCHCGNSYTDSYVNKLRHTMGEWIVDKAPTCTTEGSKIRKCSDCDYFETDEVEALGHNYEPVVTAPTCTKQGYTTYTCRCRDTYVDSYVNEIEHAASDWIIDLAPEPNVEGRMHKECTVCREILETDVIEALPEVTVPETPPETETEPETETDTETESEHTVESTTDDEEAIPPPAKSDYSETILLSTILLLITILLVITIIVIRKKKRT